MCHHILTEVFPSMAVPSDGRETRVKDQPLAAYWLSVVHSCNDGHFRATGPDHRKGLSSDVQINKLHCSPCRKPRNLYLITTGRLQKLLCDLMEFFVYCEHARMSGLWSMPLFTTDSVFLFILGLLLNLLQTMLFLFVLHTSKT
jgi:hypothetical protein